MSGAINIPKNAREVVRIHRENYRGHDLISVRVYFDAGGGEMRPSKKGLAIQASLAPALIEALAAVSSNEKEAA